MGNKYKNFVELQGSIIYPEFKIVGENEYPKFSAKIVISKNAVDTSGRAYESKDYIRIVGWGSLAEEMNDELKTGTFVEVHGQLTERSYNSPCKVCNMESKKYWYEVLVENFRVV